MYLVSEVLTQAPKMCSRKSSLCRCACKTVRRSSLLLHKDSNSHKEAVQMEVTLQASKKDGGIHKALCFFQHKAFIGALKMHVFLEQKRGCSYN